jgi:predicted amidophosphoribosyltransferase
VAKNLGVRRIHLERVRATSPQKGIADKDERAKNQRESMRVRGEIASRAVLVLDDLYMEGDTMSEAARAARDAGATAVLGLCAVKTAKGSRGLQF